MGTRVLKGTLAQAVHTDVGSELYTVMTLHPSVTARLPHQH